jgi:hypothetical protein
MLTGLRGVELCKVDPHGIACLYGVSTSRVIRVS